MRQLVCCARACLYVLVRASHFTTWLPLVDSTAALGALRRQGVGKIRHLVTRILWQQSAVKSGIVIPEKIATDWNVAYLGTKGLSRARTLFLKCLLHVYDSEEGAYVGEDEYASQLQRDLMKSAVR